MKKLFTLGIAAILMVGLIGCGGKKDTGSGTTGGGDPTKPGAPMPPVGGGDKDAKIEVVMKDMIKGMNDIADELDKIKDKETAEAAEKKIDTLAANLEKLGKEGEKLGEPSKALAEKYLPEVGKAAGRMAMAAEKAAKVETAKEAVMRIGEKLKKLGPMGG